LNRFALLLVCTFGAVLLAGGSASAAESTLEINIAADPVESVATSLEATGTTENGRFVLWSVHPAGGTGCGPDPTHDTGHIATAESEDIFSSGAYHVSADWTPTASGSYLLCGWIEDGVGSVLAHASLPFVVRAPNLSVSLKAPSTVEVGHTFRVTTTAQAEAPRQLYEYIVPSKSGVCPANAAEASSRAHVVDPKMGPGTNVNIWPVNGGPLSKTFSQSLARPGAWLICAYFQYGGTSNPPEASASAAITVKPAKHRHHRRRHHSRPTG